MSAYQIRQVQIRPPEVMPVHGTTVPPSPPVMVPLAHTVVGSTPTRKTGPPLSPCPAALALPTCSASTMIPYQLPSMLIAWLVAVTLILHRVPDLAPLVQTKSPTWLVEAPMTGFENSFTPGVPL